MQAPLPAHKQHRVLLEEARRAHANGDPQARFVISWMEYLESVQKEDTSRQPVGQDGTTRSQDPTRPRPKHHALIARQVRCRGSGRAGTSTDRRGTNNTAG